jgi:hypothetical protein
MLIYITSLTGGVFVEHFIAFSKEFLEVNLLVFTGNIHELWFGTFWSSTGLGFFP